MQSLEIRESIRLAHKWKGKIKKNTHDLVFLFCHPNWGLNSLHKKVKLKVKVKVKQSHYRPGVAQRVPGS